MRQPPTTKNRLTLNVSTVKVQKPCSRDNSLWGNTNTSPWTLLNALEQGGLSVLAERNTNYIQSYVASRDFPPGLFGGLSHSLGKQLYTDKYLSTDSRGTLCRSLDFSMYSALQILAMLDSLTSKLCLLISGRFPSSLGSCPYPIAWKPSRQ